MPDRAPDCIIRLARPADVPGIFAVRTSVIENRMSMDELTDLGITTALVTQMLETSDCAWVATRDGQIVGFSMIDTDAGSLFAIFVLPTAEGCGVGRLLIHPAERALFMRHPVIWLNTGATTRAAGFYRHLGWGDAQDIGGGDIRLEKRRN